MSLKAFLNGMDETKMNITTTDKDLLNAIRYFTGKIVEQQISSQNKVPSHEFVSAVAGLVYTLLTESIPRDLVLFSKHAQRTTIKDEDFLLFCRKTSLLETMQEYKDQLDGVKRKSKRKADESDD